MASIKDIYSKKSYALPSGLASTPAAVKPTVVPTGKTSQGQTIFTGSTSAQPASPTSQATGVTIPAQFKNPKTGALLTATEVAQNIADTIPDSATVSDIGKFAGDQFTKTNQSAEQIQSDLTDLNNARNDIAVGETDPYKIASESGISYSPAELKAIENAYAGIYDPALRSAMTKLEAKQKAEEEQRQYDLDVKKYWATTGSKKTEETTTSKVGSISDYMQAEADENGLISSDTYQKAYKLWQSKGGTLSQFKNYFPAADVMDKDNQKTLPEYLKGVGTADYTETDIQSWLDSIATNIKNGEFTDEQIRSAIESMGGKPDDYIW
jgi:hypothetical protein